MPVLNNQIILFLAWLAAKRFDKNGSIFNSAQFAGIISDLFGLPTPDGYWIKLILSGRPGITQLAGGSHWQLS